MCGRHCGWVQHPASSPSRAVLPIADDRHACPATRALPSSHRTLARETYPVRMRDKMDTTSRPEHPNGSEFMGLDAVPSRDPSGNDSLTGSL